MHIAIGQDTAASLYPKYNIITWQTIDVSQECKIFVRRNGTVFILSWQPRNLQAAPHVLEQYSNYYKQLQSSSPSYIDAAKCLAQPFERLIVELAPITTRQQTEQINGRRLTLHDYLYPSRFLLCAFPANDSRSIEPRRQQYLEHPLPGVQLNDKISSVLLDSWKRYSSREVKLLPPQFAQDPLLDTPSGVFVNDSNMTYFFKSFSDPSRGRPFEELANYGAMAKAFATNVIPPNLRVCRLHGLVCDTDAGHLPRLVGILLLPYITMGPRSLYALLSPLPKLQWKVQVAKTIDALHKAGLCWGDAKPHNVLIDAQNNAWLIDFGGGYTPGWVSAADQGTAKGDKEGLAGITEWVMEGKQPEALDEEEEEEEEEE